MTAGSIKLISSLSYLRSLTMIGLCATTTYSLSLTTSMGSPGKGEPIQGASMHAAEVCTQVLNVAKMSSLSCVILSKCFSIIHMCFNWNIKDHFKRGPPTQVSLDIIWQRHHVHNLVAFWCNVVKMIELKDLDQANERTVPPVITLNSETPEWEGSLSIRDSHKDRKLLPWIRTFEN